MNRPARTLWGLVAIGGATAVGITTRDPAFTAITFVGALWVPRVLGLTGRHRHGRPWGPGFAAGRRHGVEERLAAWHRQAHEHEGSPAASGPASA